MLGSGNTREGIVSDRRENTTENPNSWVAWKDRAEKAEAELADLRSAEQGGWIAVSSGKFPQENERVDVWIVDDNTAFGGEKREYDDIWAYDSRHVGWQNGWVAYWRKRPAHPAAPKKEQD